MDFEEILNRFTSFFGAQNLAWQRQGQEARRQGDRLAGRVKRGMRGGSGGHGQARIERRSEFKSTFPRSSQLVAVSGERLSARQSRLRGAMSVVFASDRRTEERHE